MITLSHHIATKPHKARLIARLRGALSLHRQRQHLLSLDPHMLRDIGLTAAEAHAEAARPIWDAPPFWTRR